MLADWIARLPGVSGLRETDVIEDEGQLLQSVYPIDMQYGGPGRFALHPAARLDELSPLVSDANAKLLFSEWAPYWDLSAGVLMEKSPPNLIRSRFLQTLFPKSSFIYIIRHPIATSLATHKWSGTGIYELLHHWCVAHEILLDDLPALQRALLVSFESFIDDPQGVLGEVAAFLGTDRLEAPVEGLNKQVNERYFATWRRVFYSDPDTEKPVPTLSEFYDRRSWGAEWRRRFKRTVRNHVFGENRQLSSALYESQDAVAAFEERVRPWSYSLVDLSLRPQGTVIRSDIGCTII